MAPYFISYDVFDDEKSETRFYYLFGCGPLYVDGPERAAIACVQAHFPETELSVYNRSGGWAVWSIPVTETNEFMMDYAIQLALNSPPSQATSMFNWDEGWKPRGRDATDD